MNELRVSTICININFAKLSTID